MGLLELCEKYFETSNLYEVLQISETASDKEGKVSNSQSASQANNIHNYMH